MVEFALLAPFLLLLLLGIVELGYKFGQFNEVRHAVREGARFAAVSNPDRDGGGVGDSDVIDAVCDSIGLTAATIDISVRLVDSEGNTILGIGDSGDTGEISVTANVSSLSGAPLISSFVPSELTNTATFRVERKTAWTSPISATGAC